MAKAGTLPSYLDQGEIQLCEPVSFEISDFKEQQKKKRKKNRRRRNEILEYNSPAVMKNIMNHFWTTRPHEMMVPLSLKRETHFLRGRFFLLGKKYSLQQQNCVQLIFSLFHGSNVIAVTFFVLCTY